MGFFSKVRNKIKKIIPKEIRPFVPYAAAMLPGIGGLAGAYGKFANAALARAATDDEADLKDIARTGIFAAAPTALGDYAKTGNSTALSFGDKGFLSQQAKLGAAKAAGYAEQNPFKTAAAMGSTDAAIKQVELNEDALSKYNAELAAQGIGDKTARRAAIRGIYANTGTWDMDEVDNMLDTYGYKTGGRVGYKEGGTAKEKYKHFQDMMEVAKEGLASLESDVKPMSIRPLTFREGGSVDELMERVKELQDEGLDFASAMAQAQKEMGASRKAEGGSVDELMERVKELQDEGLDFASAMAQAQKEMGASRKAEGGIMDVNMEETIDTPKGDMTMDENIKVADSTLMDAYKIYRFDMMEQGLEPMSLEEFKDQAMSEGKMANMDYREFIYDASRDNFANDMFGKDYDDLTPEEVEEIDIIIEMELGKKQVAPERMMAAEGGLMNLGGREMDLRGGGFVPMGKAERADDVPARLSKNEFVMTADAVRAAGGGSVKKGADLMYDQMKQLEGQA